MACLLAACGSPPRPPPPHVETAPAWASAPRASVEPKAPSEVFFEPGLDAGGFYPRSGAAGLDQAALVDLLHEAERTHSDALILIRDGRVIVERYFGKPIAPIETMSVTKSIVSIAIGMLIDEGKIASLDAPLSTWFPEWKSGKKAKVTLRHVMTHTSGLEHRKGARVLTQQDDRLAFVRKSPIVEEPGTRFSYSNEATQLVSGVVQSAAGEPLDAYLQRKLFAPMGIESFTWERDPSGNVQAFYGLALLPRDLARIGMLMLSGGRWKETPLVSEGWVTASTTSATELNRGYGLLWWLRFDGPEQVAFYADGWLGQLLVVYPRTRMVALRMHRAERGDEKENAELGFFSFLPRVQTLAR